MSEGQHRRTLHIDYKTLVAGVFLLVSLAVVLVVLNSIDAQREAARAAQVKDQQIALRDKALDESQKAADKAVALALANGKQIDELIAELKRQNDLSSQQQQIVAALRNELAKRGVSTVIENGKVRVVPGPISTRSGAGARGSAFRPTQAPPGAGSPSGSPTGPGAPRPTVTIVSPVPPVTVTVRPPAPQPLPILTGLPTLCALIVCIN